MPSLQAKRWEKFVETIKICKRYADMQPEVSLLDFEQRLGFRESSVWPLPVSPPSLRIARALRRAASHGW